MSLIPVVLDGADSYWLLWLPALDENSQAQGSVTNISR